MQLLAIGYWLLASCALCAPVQSAGRQTNKIEKAEEMYARYLKDEFGNMFTKDMSF
jgi:beta-lactamase class A